MNHNFKISGQALQHYKKLAEQADLPFVELNHSSVNAKLLSRLSTRNYMEIQAIPIESSPDGLIVATSNPSPENLRKISSYFNDEKKINVVVTTLAHISNVLASLFNSVYLDDIANKHSNIAPNLGTQFVPSIVQKVILYIFLLVVVVGLVFLPMLTLLSLNIFLNIGISVCWGYKIFLSIANFFVRQKFPKMPPSTPDHDLPTYTVLIPLYQEEEIVVDQLINALLAFDYPINKLDIKLLLEEADDQTRQLVEKRDLPYYFNVVYTPKGAPQTKPRACNYGLEFAVGDYLTIFDAEDIPDPDQLKKVVQCFKEADEKTVCVQAALNFYNRRDNLLTRFFTIEYTAWFDEFIKTLATMKLLLPLGGTSNHFKTACLRTMGGWDAHTRTEDAELGVRIFRYGYRTSTVNSTTYEEAAPTLGNWFKQRSGWNKGYIQTYLTHMRSPFLLLKQVGFKNFISFQLYIGGNIFSFLANIWLWAFFIAVSFIFPFGKTDPLYPAWLWHLTWINFLIGNVAFVLAHLIGVLRRRWYHLVLFSPLMIFYWILISFTGYASIYELIKRPSYWYRTKHGMSIRNKK